MPFVILILTIAFNHTVAVIAHIAKELDNRETRRWSFYTANIANIIMCVMSSTAIILIGSFVSYLVIMSLTVSQSLPLVMPMAEERLLTLGTHKML